MARINRIFLIKLHTILATFIFPVAMMFFITGALYSLDIEGDYAEQEIPLTLSQDFQPSLESFKTLISEQLTSLNIDLPTSEARFRQDEKAGRMNWGGANISAVLEFKVGEPAAMLKIYDADWYQRFVRLHKAEGGDSFKLYAVMMASALLILLFSGFIMAWQIPNYRRLASISSVAGVAAFILMFWIN